MDAVMMAYQVIQMHEDLQAYREMAKEYETLREKYATLLDESLKHAQLMQGNVLRLALSKVDISEVFLVYKNDTMMEYDSPEVLFIYEDQSEAERVVNELVEAERDHVDYYWLRWELRHKKETE